MMLFLDASALAARYFGGAGSRRIRTLLGQEQEEGCAISSIALVTFSLLLRDLRMEGVPEAPLARAAASFQADLKDLVQIQVDGCLPLAGSLAIRYGFPMEPAIQLAAALRLEARLEWNAKPLPPPLVRVVSLDPGLNRAARKEGLATL